MKKRVLRELIRKEIYAEQTRRMALIDALELAESMLSEPHMSDDVALKLLSKRTRLRRELGYSS